MERLPPPPPGLPFLPGYGGWPTVLQALGPDNRDLPGPVVSGTR